MNTWDEVNDEALFNGSILSRQGRRERDPVGWVDGREMKTRVFNKQPQCV